MAEITDVNLLEIFVGKQNLDIAGKSSEYINYRECKLDPDTNATKVTYGHIKQSAFDEIKGVFTGILRFLTSAKHLLQLLWIREIALEMGPLRDEDMYDFIQDAFVASGVEISDETVVEVFFSLLHEGYLQEKITGDDWIRDYSLTSKGKNAAAKTFEMMKTLISSPIESSAAAAPPSADSPFPDRSDSIDETKGMWITQDEFLKKKNITIRTLGTYRNSGKRAKDGLSGTDTQGNRWRKRGTGPTEKPQYFLPKEE